MSNGRNNEKVNDLISNSGFEIGGEDQLKQVGLKIQEVNRNKKDGNHLNSHWMLLLF